MNSTAIYIEQIRIEPKPKILVVDDEERNLRLIEALLIPLGYAVILARDGGEALEGVREIPPDVILLDAMMPRLDGFEVARRLKGDNETRIIPIVMVTALNEVGDRVKALEAGADDFLTKPVEKTELRARVRSLLKVKAYHDYQKNYQRELEDEVARQTEELRLAFEKLRDASLDTIHRLCRASEYQDDDTGAHILRMSHYAAAVARKMGQNQNYVEAIRYAAPMHDVGKIGVPDHILLKPGRLDRNEWEIMKAHPTIGSNILADADSEFIRFAQVITLTHHEKWDGSGYPKGLKGEDIPLVGRIVAIADVFDALTSKRPYKAAYSVEKAYEIIKTGRGSHFDPAVVDAFFAVEDDILSILRRYNDGVCHADGAGVSAARHLL